MSRTTSPRGQPTPPTQGTPVPHDKIAMRAYEKWVKRGRPDGTSDKDWIEAEAELRAEHARGSNNQNATNATNARR